MKMILKKVPYYEPKSLNYADDQGLSILDAFGGTRSYCWSLRIIFSVKYSDSTYYEEGG